jgi:small subunit ribosomal protein S20
MANLKSSKKDIRRIAKRTEASRSVKSSLKTYIKRVREAVTGGDQTQITEALNRAQKMLDKAVKRGFIHKNQASRRKSRIALAASKAQQPS